VANEESNPRALRRFAAEELQRIGTEAGIRQASLLAETVMKTLEQSVGRSLPRSRSFAVPLVPFF